jgi:hypothetical protein
MPISQITGASIQDGSIVVADLGITTFNTGTGNTLTLQANSATGLVIDVTGNTAIANSLSFSATGARIRGDFSTSPITNRVAFQTNTTNSGSRIGALPNGTSGNSSFDAFNNSDPLNSAYGRFGIAATTDVRIESTIVGTGTYLPLTMYTGGSERLRIDTSGNVGIGTTSPSNAKLHVVGDWVGGSSTVKAQTITSFASGGQAGYGTYDSNGTRIGLFYSYTSGTVLGTSTASPLSFETNGVERARIDSAGRIGIGTTSPSQLLHVAAGTILSSNTAGTTATVSIAGNGSVVGTSDFSLQQGSSSEAYVYNRANSFLVLGTNNAERMRILSGGNVGIGLTAPSERLEISGNYKQSNGTQGIQIVNTTVPYIQAFTTGGNNPLQINGQDLRFFTGASFGAESEKMRIDSAGNVGINITPSAWVAADYKAIQIGAGGSSIYGGNSAGFAPIALVSNAYVSGASTAYTYLSTAGAGFYRIQNNTHSWGIAPSGTAGTTTTFTTAMTIDTSGNVGIGTTGPAAKLHVNSSAAPAVQINTSSTGGSIAALQISLSSSTPGTDAKPLFMFTEATPSANWRFIQCNSAQSSSPREEFRVTGNGIIFAQNTSVQSISDIRLKQNIRTSEDGLNIITALRPVRFDWKPEKNDTRSNQLGFIAQEIQQVFPDAVTVYGKSDDPENPYLAVGPGELIPVLVKAIQEQQAIIESLTARIETLEKN